MGTGRLSAAALTTLMLWGVPASFTLAQEPPGAAATQVDYSIAAGSLSQALLQFGTQSGVQVIAPSELTAGRSSAGLSGRLDLDSALRGLLQGTGLNYRLSAQRSVVTLLPPRADSGTRELGVVDVEGWAGASGSGGANGSTDVTATEGTGSYTTTAISIGSKTPQSIKETPQSVSVLTQEQLKAQNVTDIGSAMEKAPGVTVVQSGVTQQFYSRGWQIDSVQVDGGVPFRISSGDAAANQNNVMLGDLAMYDHVELLRGGDGLNGAAASNPGGSVNLVRKRPLDHYYLGFEAQAGSWDNYRSSLDVTGPLAFDGRLRGRLVSAWQDRDFFYDKATETNKLLYGILEADVTDSTLLSVGASYERKSALPVNFGLPRLSTGRDAHLPRSTSLAFDWNYLHARTRQAFVQVRQGLGEDWTLDGQLTKSFMDYDLAAGAITGAIPVDGMRDTRGNSGQGYLTETNSVTWDMNLAGKFKVLDLPQSTTFSINRQKSNARSISLYAPSSSPADINTPEFDWEVSRPSTSTYTQSSAVAKLDAVFLPFLPGLHFQTAFRWDEYLLQNRLYDTVETRTSTPYYALRYDFNPNWSAYASYTDLYQYQAYLTTPAGVPLPPMTGSTKEVGIKYSKGSLNAALSLYRAERENLAVWVASSGTGVCVSLTGCYETGGLEESRGVDLEISGEPLPWWSVSFGYTYNLNEKTYDPSQVRTGDLSVPLSAFTPKHMAKFWNDVALSGNPYLERTRLGLGVIAQSRNATSVQACVRDSGTRCLEYQNVDIAQGFYSVVSARAAYQLDKNWKLALNVDNLLDRRYYSTVGGIGTNNWYGEPRNYMLTLSGQF